MNRGFQSILFANEPLSVSDLTAQIKQLIEENEDFMDVRVSGELSNVSRPASGHIYFTLKDGGAQIKCAMWKAQAMRMTRAYTPKNGDAVVARGRVGVYERDGTYQLYIDALTPSGVGDLFAEFERLKQKLDAEGLFDPARKRPLPALPHRLGVVTSPSTAAFQDILNVLRRRYPLLEVILSPTLVQGAEAASQIIAAIERLNGAPDDERVDVILVARGGGSLEDLWCFNDERVARAIATSDIPIITGVGHEIDFTLADFAADVRAPTPSAAAEMLTPDINDFRLAIDSIALRLNDLIQARLESARADLGNAQRSLRLLSPLNQVLQARGKFEALQRRFNKAVPAQLYLSRMQLDGLSRRLDAISPLATLARGYAIVQRASDDAVVHSTNDVQVGEAIRVRVTDGELGATIHESRVISHKS